MSSTFDVNHCEHVAERMSIRFRKEIAQNSPLGQDRSCCYAARAGRTLTGYYKFFIVPTAEELSTKTVSAIYFVVGSEKKHRPASVISASEAAIREKLERRSQRGKQ